MDGGDKPQPKRQRTKAKRKRHQPEFKARVAWEALKGVKTIQQIAQEYQVHPVQVSEWKKIVVQSAAEAFRPDRASSSAEELARKRKPLQAKIGELTIDLDGLREKSKPLGL